MIHLLGYLLVRNGGGTWRVSCHRSLDGLLSDWNSAITSDVKSSAVAHVGFWRPDTSCFDSVCSAHEGRVLLTGAAKLSLPRSFSAACSPCAFVEGLPVHLALSGWGYEIEDPSVNEAVLEQNPALGTVALPEMPKRPVDWLATLERESPELFAECYRLSILSEHLYLEREGLLAHDVRDRLAYYRFKALAGYPPSRDVMVEGLMFAPPWILNLSTRALDLPVRGTKGLGRIGATTVADIAKVGPEGLMSLRNMGRTTVSAISAAIFAAFKFGSANCDTEEFKQGRTLISSVPAIVTWQVEPEREHAAKTDDATQMAPLVPHSFREALDAAICLPTKRAASILRQRMGIGGGRKTLEEIGQTHDLTRERVRQIEAKAVGRLVARMPVWRTRFRAGLAKMLSGRQEPLPLLGLEVLDPWFAGADALIGPFEFALEHFITPPEFHVVRVAGQMYVSMLFQDEWNEAERASRALLAALLKRERSLPESEARLLIESQLVGRGEELRSLLWDVTTRWAHFTEGPSGERTLVSFGTGAESLVEAVLSESETPLHYSEIAKRCSTLKGRAVDVRRAANAAANVGYLLGRGVYGLQKHIDLSSDEQSRVLGEVEEMLSETPSRQWHANEICDELETRGMDFEGRLSKYDLNVILQASTVLTSLGRMVWTARTNSVMGSSDRLNIWQMVVALIQEHGAPMVAADIREIISKDRGLAETFQIHQADPLIRVGVKKWGILWRDVPFDEIQAEAVVNEIISILNDRGTGLHLTEIIPSLSVNRGVAEGVNPLLLVSLALRFNGVKYGRGGYIYLVEWGGPRRLAISEAVEKAFDELGNGVLAADVAKRASILLGRIVPNNVASSILMKIGIYDSNQGLWLRPEFDSGSLDEQPSLVLYEEDA